MDDYHDLKVTVGKLDATIRTNTGYYDEPVYHDEPSQGRSVTVEVLERLLVRIHGSKDIDFAHELSELVLTERVSSTRLLSLKARMPGDKSRAAIVAWLIDRPSLLSQPAIFPSRQSGRRPCDAGVGRRRPCDRSADGSG